MASIRAIFIITTDNKILFNRRFPTIENRLKKHMGDNYIAIPSDKIICNAFFNKVIREELLQEEFQSKTYKEDLEIDHQKMNELIEVVDINLNLNNFQNYSECPIVTLDIGNNKNIWPVIYIKKFKVFGVIFPNIDFEKFKNIKLNIIKKENNLKQQDDILFQTKKLYEEQDLSIVGSFTLIENLLNYVISNKIYEENKIQTLISNMVPFGNIIETNINFILESLNFLNQRFIGSNIGNQDKKGSDEKIKIPGWVTKIPSFSSERLNITIKEELKFVKYGQNKNFNIILCDISCLAELSQNCEITLPIKENKTNYLGNLRIHPCAKLEDQNILNDATRIIFIPPHDEFKMGVFEIENIDQENLPIRGDFSLKESAQNEVKLYLNVVIDEKKAIGKFDYFYINIPLGHFGTIIDTKIMVQVGEVSLINNKTTLHWDLQNKVFDKFIVLSGTVNYVTNKDNIVHVSDKKEDNKEINESEENNDERYKRNNGDINSSSINIDEIMKTRTVALPRSDIMSTNCFCKIHFKLCDYSLSNIEIDKKSLLFYPKLSPRIDIRRQFISNEFIVWNNLSFNNHDLIIPEKTEISLLKINIEDYKD